MVVYEAIIFDSDDCTFDCIVGFHYQPAEDSADTGPIGADLEVGLVHKVLNITTRTGVELPYSWLVDRGWREWSNEYVERQLERQLIPGCYLWEKILEQIEC